MLNTTGSSNILVVLGRVVPCYILPHSCTLFHVFAFVVVGKLLIAGEGYIGRGLEELLPELYIVSLVITDSDDTIYLGGFPDSARVVAILFYKRQNACRYYAMRLAEVMIDFLASRQQRLERSSR